jgi:hypothetical protein
MIRPVDLLDADIEALRAGAQRWDDLTLNVEEVFDRLTRVTADLPHHWSGSAAETAQGTTRELRIILGNAFDQIRAVARAMRAFADDIERIGQDLRDLMEEARSDGCTIDLYSATVSGPAGNSYADPLAHVLGRAAAADDRARAVLDANRLGDHHPMPSGRIEQPTQDPSGMDRATPEERAHWWAQLNPVMQDDLVAQYPEIIGALDGLPWPTRDAANRILLARDKERLWSERTQLLAAQNAMGTHPDHRRILDLLDENHFELEQVAQLDETVSGDWPYLVRYKLGSVFDGEVCPAEHTPPIYR